MAKLKMDGGSKMAVGMWAKDGEYVDFSQKCDCDGKVRPGLQLADLVRPRQPPPFNAPPPPPFRAGGGVAEPRH